MAKGNNTGETVRRTRPQTYREIVRLLGAGVAVRKIARLLKVSPDTINAISAHAARDISAVKQDIRAISARIAFGAAEQIEDELAAGAIKGTQLVPVYGVAVDKVVSLSDSAPDTFDFNQYRFPNRYLFRAAHDPGRDCCQYQTAATGPNRY